MRLVSRMCGNRFGRGVVIPGGVAAEPGLPEAQLAARGDRPARPHRAPTPRR